MLEKKKKNLKKKEALLVWELLLEENCANSLESLAEKVANVAILRDLCIMY